MSFGDKIHIVKTVDCKNCGDQTTKTNSRYNEAIKHGWNFFCSIKCRYAFEEKSIEFFYAWCLESIRKTPAQIRQTKTNVFVQSLVPPGIITGTKASEYGVQN